MIWGIKWTHKALKDIGCLDRHIQVKVNQAVERLAKIGHGDVERVKGSDSELRLRVGGLRVFFIYLKEDRAICILRVRPRGSAYKK